MPRGFCVGATGSSWRVRRALLVDQPVAVVVAVVARHLGVRGVHLAAGVVALNFGGNISLGGSLNDTRNWGVPLLRATLEADGTVLVRDGQLVVGSR